MVGCELTHAANLFNIDALYELAIRYDNGFQVPHNLILALHWYLQAAQQGSIDAQWRASEMLANGEGVASPDFVQSNAWAREAADRGHLEAQLRLSERYRAGKDGVSKDNAIAAHWLQLAANQGSVFAMETLGWIYNEGEHGLVRDDEVAIQWYRRAIELGSITALNNLGWMYEHGHGVERNMAKAAELYRKAADKGSASAANNLGNWYLVSDGVEQSDADAFFWFHKSANANNAMAQCNLAWMYDLGRGVEQSDEQAAKAGCKEAQNSTGMSYALGLGTDHDLLEATRWFFLAEAQGEVDAPHQVKLMEYLATLEHVLEKNASHKELATWFRQAAELNYSAASYNLALLYSKGYGVPQDFQQALYWIDKAKEQGYSVSPEKRKHFSSLTS
ncbi:hypothetical protein BGZ73_003368 [Actinomortierella ambigua]|nr:hypothetical protein BGZ73_003368 [Actinomortierella ambigua]